MSVEVLTWISRSKNLNKNLSRESSGFFILLKSKYVSLDVNICSLTFPPNSSPNHLNSFPQACIINERP